MSQNRYTYAGNDPVNLDDPSGHGWLKKAVKKIISKAKTVAKKKVTTVKKMVSNAKKAAKNKLNNLKAKTKKVVKKNITAFKKKVAKKAAAAKRTVSKVKKQITKKVQNIKKGATKLYTKAKGYAKAAINTIKSKTTNLVKVGNKLVSKYEVKGCTTSNHINKKDTITTSGLPITTAMITPRTISTSGTVAAAVPVVEILALLFGTAVTSFVASKTFDITGFEVPEGTSIKEQLNVLMIYGIAIITKKVQDNQSSKSEEQVDEGTSDSKSKDEDHMLGENGTQVGGSKTTGKSGNKKERVDVENPAPGEREGDVHYHDPNNKKWRYDTKSGKLVDPDTGEEAPSGAQKVLKEDWFKKALDKALDILGENNGN